MKCPLLCVALLLPAVLAGAADIYKYVDEHGRVFYSDQPDPRAQKLDIQAKPLDAANAARIAHDQRIYKAEEAQRRRERAAEDKRLAEEQRNQEERCRRARSRYYSMRDARRLYSYDDNGNRIYYADKEADARRAEAQQAMQSACGS